MGAEGLEKVPPHTFFHPLVGSHSSHNQTAVPRGPLGRLEVLKCLPRLVTGQPFHTPRPLDRFPLSLTNSHLTFPGAPAALLHLPPAALCRCSFSLPTSPKFWGSSYAHLSLPPLERGPSLSGPFGILGTVDFPYVPV